MVAPLDPHEVLPPAEPLDFETVYATHFAFVWRSLRQLGVPEGHLDDAAQSVFLVVHRRGGDFEGRASVRTWLFRIAMRVASDVRRTHRRRGVTSDTDTETLTDTGPDPQACAEQREALAALESVLSRLDDRQRAVFVMAEIEQMTGPEIADALGISLNTVGSRLRAARQAFERALARLPRRTW